MNTTSALWRVHDCDGWHQTPGEWAEFHSPATAYAAAFRLIDKQHRVYLRSPDGRAFKLSEIDAITGPAHE